MTAAPTPEQFNLATELVRVSEENKHLAAEVARLTEERDKHRKLSGQANYLLARVVAAANISPIEGEDGFVASYDMPVGPIHKAIPFLAEQGIHVTYDGQIKNGPEAVIEAAATLAARDAEKKAGALEELGFEYGTEMIAFPGTSLDPQRYSSAEEAAASIHAGAKDRTRVRVRTKAGEWHPYATPQQGEQE
jgi:hypothetical protein